MTKAKLIEKNGVEIITQNYPKTPRCALCLYFSIEKPEKYAGVYNLFTKLLFQGTKNRTAAELADELENNGIEITAKCKQDYLRVSALFLNEDFERALDILADIMENSTFDDFEKEVFKSKGEINSDLDAPKTKVCDAFIGEIFKGHYYENNHTKTLLEIDKIQKEDVKEVLGQLKNSKKVVSIAADFLEVAGGEDAVVEQLCTKLAFMKKVSEKQESQIPKVADLTENAVIKTAKNDANQAQIIQGWIVESMESKDYAKIIVMNNILGASGLSSRLFCELRDKKGLAYTVRSSYETMRCGAVLNLYIATSPENIEKSLDGFSEEIKKLQTTPVSEQELEGGKENVLGRLEYFSQTNSHRAGTKGFDYISGLGINYEEKYREDIAKVSAEDIMEVAEKYLSKPCVTAILAPEGNI